MKIATLKNGAEEALPLVVVMQMIVTRMMEGFPGAIDLYELVQKCRDSNHRLFGNSEANLKAEGLIEPSGHIHSSTRNIIISMVSGEGLDMAFGNPVVSVRDEEQTEPAAEHDEPSSGMSRNTMQEVALRHLSRLR